MTMDALKNAIEKLKYVKLAVQIDGMHAEGVKECSELEVVMAVGNM